jgi:hypothetical protein
MSAFGSTGNFSHQQSPGLHSIAAWQRGQRMFMAEALRFE